MTGDSRHTIISPHGHAGAGLRDDTPHLERGTGSSALVGTTPEG